jgi:hypothetical protein
MLSAVLLEWVFSAIYLIVPRESFLPTISIAISIIVIAILTWIMNQATIFRTKICYS